MKIWKRNVVVAIILLFVCAAVWLNWNYGQEADLEGETADGKLLGEATLVLDAKDGESVDANTTDDGSEGKDESTEDAQSTEDTNTITEGESNTTQTGYFSSARLNRQQARDSALSLLQEAAADETANQTVIDEANASIQTMAQETVTEAQVENLITAKGYTDCICFISDASASVVVSSIEGGMTDVDTARIIDIVKEETGLTASQVKIIEAEP